MAIAHPTVACTGSIGQTCYQHADVLYTVYVGRPAKASSEEERVVSPAKSAGKYYIWSALRTYHRP